MLRAGAAADVLARYFEFITGIYARPWARRVSREMAYGRLVRKLDLPPLGAGPSHAARRAPPCRPAGRAMTAIAAHFPENSPSATPPANADEWDAGDLACGELLIALRARLRAMPGEVLKLVARDPGAPEDLAAWCRLTGNTLLHHDNETHAFWIASRNA